MNERIKYIRNLLNLSQADFAKKIGITQSMVSLIEKDNFISNQIIITICSVFNVNKNWLVNGEGDIFNNSVYYNDFITIFNNLSEPLQEFIFITAKNLLDTQDKLKK